MKRVAQNPLPFDLDVAVSFTNEVAWKAVFDPSTSWLEPRIRLVFEAIDLRFPVMEVSFLFADQERVRDLNRSFRGQDKPTNVLSFPSFERADYDNGRLSHTTHPFLVGDIVFSLETIAEEAAALEKPFEEHLTHLLIHGLLHLRGYDHETDAEAAEMEKLEIHLLSQLGLSNPYAQPLTS